MTIIEQAVAHYGSDNQTRKAVQELTELSLALQRALKGRADNENILEEMADVKIMLSQLELIFGNPQPWINKKLIRLTKRIAG